MSSRIYPGLWQVKVFFNKWEEHPRTGMPVAVEYYDITEPDIYEECEARCLLYAYGVPHDEGGASGIPVFRTVTRAKIIPAGSED